MTGPELRRRMREQGLTVEQLARILNRTSRTVFKWRANGVPRSAQRYVEMVLDSGVAMRRP